MSTDKNKSHKAKEEACISLQFWFDKKGTPIFTLTTNEHEEEWGFSGGLFAQQMFADKNLMNLLSEKDLSMLRSFCDTFITNYDQHIKQVIWEQTTT